MKNEKYVGMMKDVMQKGMKTVCLATFCIFAVLFCIMSAVIGMIYSAADYAVRKLEKA